MSRLRLLQVTHDLGIGGLPKVVATLCAALDRDRFDVRVLCLNAKGPLADEIESGGIPVHSIAKPAGGPDYLAIVKVWRVLRRMRIDVLHTHNTQPFIEAGIAAVAARVPTHVHTDHGRQFPDRRRYMFAERFVSRFAYRIVGVSDETCRQLIEWEGLDPSKLVTIQNGIDPAPFDRPVDPAEIRAELGVSEGAPLVGVVARFSPEKGVEFAIRALKLVRERRDEAVLALVGYGPEEDALRRETANLGLDGAVRFLGPRSDVPRLLKAFDVSVLPSLREGLPMTLLESMAARCPLVASRVGGVPSALDEGRAGVLVGPGEPSALAEAILGLVDDPARGRRLADLARRRFEDRFSADAMARRYEALFLRQAEEDDAR